MIRWLLQSGYRMVKKKELLIDSELDSAVLLEILMRRSLQVVRGLLLGLRHGRMLLAFVGRNVRIRYAGRVKIGSGCFLDDGVLIDGLGSEGVVLGRMSSIGAYTRLIASTTIWKIGKGIRLGDNVSIGEFSRIGGSGGVEIGDGTITGQYLSIHPENHVFEGGMQDPHATLRAGIRIGRNCWIGAKVTILAGVEIGDDCVIGAGSLVTKSVPSRSLAVGVPARVLREIA